MRILDPKSSDAAISVDPKRSYTGTASTSRPPIPEKWVQVAGYRYYSPELGRWVSRDPVNETGSINLYVTAINNTVNLIDVLGMYDSERNCMQPKPEEPEGYYCWCHPDGNWHCLPKPDCPHGTTPIHLPYGWACMPDTEPTCDSPGGGPPPPGSGGGGGNGGGRGDWYNETNEILLTLLEYLSMLAGYASDGWGPIQNAIDLSPHVPPMMLTIIIRRLQDDYGNNCLPSPNGAKGYTEDICDGMWDAIEDLKGQLGRITFFSTPSPAPVFPPGSYAGEWTRRSL